jgi:predicted kinase
LPFDALLAVAGYLGLEGRQEDRARGQERARASSVATLEAALVHELRVLLMVVGNRVTSRQLAADSKFRVLRPEWQPMPEGHWEREQLAVERIRNGLEVLYANG